MTHLLKDPHRIAGGMKWAAEKGFMHNELRYCSALPILSNLLSGL